MKNPLSSGEMKELIAAKLSHTLSVEPMEATDDQFYFALALIVRDLLMQKRTEFMKRAEAQSCKKIYYLCMEFLMGRSLKPVQSGAASGDRKCAGRLRREAAAGV